MNFSIGLSALRASQFALNTVSQNLANANTEGYHRQRVGFQTRLPQFIQGRYLGSGVEIGTIDRMRNQILESTYTRSVSDLQSAGRQLSLEGQIESLFLPGDGSIHNAVGGFFDELNRLSANPSELVQRNAVVQQGVNAAKQVRDISERLTDLKQTVRNQIEIEVNSINQDIESLVDLQHRIQVASARGVPNDLYDQRDQLINRLAEKIDVQRFEQSQNGFGLSLAGSSIAIGDAPIAFETVYDDNGNVAIHVAGSDREVKFGSGSLIALAEVHNETIDDFQSRIDEFARDFIRNVDQAHAKGVGTSGPFSILRGTRSVGNPQIPLNESEIPFPVEKGELYFSVTDPSGEKRTYAVAIDPATESLDDVAAKIGNVANVQAVVDEQNGTLNIIAQPGYRFDFSGNLETVPDLGSFTGTSLPRISGQYEGDVNRELSVSVIGTGTIGKTPGLLAQVTDESTGKVIAEINIGEGYEAGSELAVTEGVSISFGGGDVTDSDSFTTRLIADSDSTGILSALGLNNFFKGSDAKTIDVETRIVENPNELATSRSGDIADTTNLNGLLTLREAHTMGEGRLSFEDFLGETSSEIGFRVQTSQSLYRNISELNYQYQTEIASVSGVDLNEEMVDLANYQKSYEAAVQVMRTMETMMDELLALVR